MGTLFKLKKQGYTLVIAEHRLSWLSELADRIIYMEKGRIVREYTPKEFTAMPEMERRNKGASDDAPCTNTRTATTSETFSSVGR